MRKKLFSINLLISAKGALSLTYALIVSRLSPSPILAVLSFIVFYLSLYLLNFELKSSTEENTNLIY